ncbi:MAG: DMT family transporter, partial [Mucispirillum sp.]|nr:DMT family transporter [Mucispirillum sp.]
ALCFVSWSKAVKILGTVKTSMYIYLVPAVTVVSSVIILQEPITLTAGFGIALITSGLILSGRK